MGMKKYASLAVCSMQNTLSYRLTFILNFVANFVNLIAIYCLWQAIYTGETQLGGYTWEQMKVYLIVTFFVNSMLSYYSESRITGKVIDGSVAMDLLKPLDFQKARLAEILGSCVLEGILSSLLICILVIFTFGISISIDVWTAILFVLSMISSVLVKFGIVYLSALLCFWTTSGLGIIWARMAITNLLSGALVPLAFFPDWLKMIALLLPFQGIVHTPTMIFLGNVEPVQAIQMITLQWGWIIVLWFCGKWMWSKAVRQITIHGG